MRLHRHSYHFVGIGGIGMCGLAEVLHRLGAKVTGSDLNDGPNTQRLRQIGVEVFIGHKSENLGLSDVVVFSSAVKDDNPEIQSARARRIPIIRRAEALAEIMRFKRGIAIGGTHGKTTTTSMVASIFIQAHLDPTIVVGGRFSLIESTAFLGAGEWVIAEADESDGSFGALTPEFSVITNIDSDHLDYYKSMANLEAAFVRFAEKVPFYGAVIACGDDPNFKLIFAGFEKRLITYGFDAHNDYVLDGSHGRYTVTHHRPGGGRSNFDLQVPIPGRHNALNGLAAVLVAQEAGVSFEMGAQFLINFQGVDRRFQFKGEESGISIYDDYGHHPREIQATLQGFVERFPDRSLKVIFQPHRFSRTQLCWPEFINCFGLVKEVMLTDIYPAGEAPIAGITSERLAREIVGPKVVYIPKQDLLDTVLGRIKSGDVVLTLGAGDITRLGPQLLEKLK